MQVLRRSFLVFIQMKRLFLLLLLCKSALAVAVILFAGCNKEEEPMADPVTMPVVPLPQNHVYSYLALGDSYTIGQSVAEEERFPHLTVDLLRQQDIFLKEPEYIAQTGWSTIALQNAIISREPLKLFDIVTLLIGVNDQYQHLDTAGYRVRFTVLLNKAIELAGNRPKRVFVLSIPDYSATPFVEASQKATVRKEIDLFNAINKEITIDNKVAYVDITPSTRDAANDASLLANDGLHYSAKEHKRWAEKLSPLIKGVLR